MSCRTTEERVVFVSSYDLLPENHFGRSQNLINLCKALNFIFSYLLRKNDFFLVITVER